VTDVSRFEEADNIGFVCRGSHRGGESFGGEDGGIRGQGVGREAFVNNNKVGGPVGGVRKMTIKRCMG
jgi:hypothetical protein